jgi:hypothetical protein
MPLQAIPEYDVHGDIVLILREDEQSETEKERQMRMARFERNMCPPDYDQD